MSDEVQPPQFGEPESGASGEKSPWVSPAPAPTSGWSSPEAVQQPGWGQPTPGPTQPQPSWPSPYPPAGGPQPSAPTQPNYYPAPGQQPAGYPPYGNQLAWGAPPASVGRNNRRLAAILGGSIAALAGAGILIAAVVLSGNGKHSSSTTATGAASSSAPIPSATAIATAQGGAPTPTDATSASSVVSATSSTSVVPLDSCPTAASLTAEHAGYVACGMAAKDVGIPAYDSAQAHRNYTVTLKTNRGDVVFTATGSSAPYTVNSFLYLVQKQYYDNSPCHRLTTRGIYVLQCGDPTGSGTGGPGYEFQDENLNAFGHAGSGGSVTYPAGTVAMANAGYGTNGSQFFLVYRDTMLPPRYTPFGTVTKGLNILTSIAAHGTDDTLGDGDGSPIESVSIEKVIVSAS